MSPRRREGLDPGVRRTSLVALIGVLIVAAIGIGRGGTPGGNSSGDIFLAFSTADPEPMPHAAGAVRVRHEINPDLIDPLYLAAVEAVEEAVVNALVAGEDVATVKPEGMVCRALDTGRLRAIFGLG